MSPPARRWGRNVPPLVIAHRGASAERPENTLVAFRLAAEQGADGVELDVMRCGSGEVVVFHDDDLVRLAGRPESVRATPLSSLRAVDLGGGAGIPTLAEVFAAIPDDLLVNVELKAAERHGAGHLVELIDDGLAAETAAIIARNRPARVLVSSFHPLLLARLRRAAPDLATGLLFEKKMSRPLRDAWLAPALGVGAVHPEAALCTARAVAAWHAAGRAVNAWTVDDPHEIAFLAAVGVDGVITNRPAATRARLAAAA